jgi:ribosomal protein S18 acetylase RimI-like enzyme
MLTIEQLTADQASTVLPALVELLQDSVAGGASVGFLPPLTEAAARDYWHDTIASVAQGELLLLVARQDGQVVGTVQLALAGKPNARHRAEVQKLMVHTRARRQGIGQALLAAVEEIARQRERTLLVLDTRQSDPSELLYLKHGYTRAGSIPRYARSANGELHATVFFYRILA